MKELNFIFDLEFAIKPIWFSVILIFLYLLLLRKKVKNFFTKFFIQPNDNQERKIVNNLFILIEIAFLTIYIFAIWDLMLVDKNIKDFGQWGDFFGGIVNPILTFITFIALLITIVLQQIELKESREEFKKSAEALTKQEKHMELQTFENTFFKMVELHNNIVENLSYSKEEIIKGRKVFEEIFNEIFKHETFYRMIYTYFHINSYKNYVLGHYFRNLYQILKFLKSQEEIIGQNNIKTYANILRSQLSSFEVMLLFINCFNGVSDDGKFRKLLIHFSFLQHIPFTKDINIKDIKIADISNWYVYYYHPLEFEKRKDSIKILGIYTINNKKIDIALDVFCQYFENGKNAFDGNEVVEKIKHKLDCAK